MKITSILLTCLLSLPLFIGCGETEDASESVLPVDSVSALPADDDIEGLYRLGILTDWYNTEDPVV